MIPQIPFWAENLIGEWQFLFMSVTLPCILLSSKIFCRVGELQKQGGFVILCLFFCPPLSDSFNKRSWLVLYLTLCEPGQSKPPPPIELPWAPTFWFPLRCGARTPCQLSERPLHFSSSGRAAPRLRQPGLRAAVLGAVWKQRGECSSPSAPPSGLWSHSYWLGGAEGFGLFS